MTPTSTDAGSRPRWLILALIGVAQLMVVLDATIVNIALPSAQAALGFSDESRQWVVTAYALSFGSLLLLGGRLGDLFGRKRVFVTGLAGFAAASALGGFASSFGVLVGARALQGAFAALLAPAALSLLTTTFTVPEGAQPGVLGLRRDRRLGRRRRPDPRRCADRVPGLALDDVRQPHPRGARPPLAALRLLPDDAVPTSRARIDLPGTLTASAGLFALVYGFSSAESDGWGSALTIAGLAAGVALLAAFVAVERRVEHPLLPLRVVADGPARAASWSIAVVGAGMFGVFLFLTYYMQQTLGFSPLVSGLAFLPMMAVIMPAGAIGQTRLLPARRPAAAGRRRHGAQRGRDAHAHRCRRGLELRGRRAARACS